MPTLLVVYVLRSSSETGMDGAPVCTLYGTVVNLNCSGSMESSREEMMKFQNLSEHFIITDVGAAGR